jgi:putative ABC transport system permease protein
MFKVAWSSVRANKVRLLLTSFAIVIGVAFVAGSFVFTDTINSRFESLLGDISAGVDVYVYPDDPEFGNEFGQVQVSFPEDVFDDVMAVNGVSQAEAGVAGLAQLVDDEGEVIGGFGPPTLGFSWGEIPDLTPMRIASGNGRSPAAPGEVVLDVATAKAQGFVVGQTISILFTGPVEQFTLVGIANFGDEDNAAGATLALFEFDEAQRVFELDGRISQISIAANSDVSAEVLAERVSLVLPDGARAITASQSNADQTAEIAESLGILTTMLLVFAALAVFVGSFVIYNTFRIIVAQRTRELALLRAIGATGGQVTRMVVIESFVVAMFSSAIGVLGGVGLAVLLQAAMNAAGFGLPDGSLTLLPRTVIIAMLVGVVVTVVASVLPAVRAAKIPPVAAMQADLSATTRRSLRRRTIAGLAVTGVGALGVAIGLFGDIDNGIWILALGALTTFIGISVLAPIAARPFANFVGFPIRKVYKVAGDLAVENTRRQPRRTASTASALMIGVALVVFVAILAASIKVSVGNTVAEIFPADLSISSSNFTIGVSPEYIEELRSLPEIGEVTTLNQTQIRLGEDVFTVTAIEPATSSGVLFVGAEDAELAALERTNGLLVHVDQPDAAGQIGRIVLVELPNGAAADAEIVGVFDDPNFGEYLMTRDRYITGIDPVSDGFILANAAEGTALGDAKTAAESAATPFPNVEVQTGTELVDDAKEQIDAILVIFTALLLLAIIIAILGITNTLALSIIERTREIGLLRAIGMSRRQLRRMIRWEAVIIAVFGAILGMFTGIVLSWAVVQALKDEGLGDFAIPFGQLVFLVFVAAVAGVFAAIYPAYKASRLNILEAISYE